MMAHVPLNYLPDAKTVLVIGGGDGGVAREALRHSNLERIFLVDIDIKVMDISRC